MLDLNEKVLSKPYESSRASHFTNIVLQDKIGVMHLQLLNLFI